MNRHSHVSLCAFDASHHCSNIQQRSVISLILRYSFYASLLDMESRCEALNLGIQSVALDEGFSVHSAVVGVRSSAHTSDLLWVLLIGVLKGHLGASVSDGRRAEAEITASPLAVRILVVCGCVPTA